VDSSLPGYFEAGKEVGIRVAEMASYGKGYKRKYRNVCLKIGKGVLSEKKGPGGAFVAVY